MVADSLLNGYFSMLRKANNLEKHD